MNGFGRKRFTAFIWKEEKLQKSPLHERHDVKRLKCDNGAALEEMNFSIFCIIALEFKVKRVG
jgi:hypothetical protein